jgi:hypothetical protein
MTDDGVWSVVPHGAGVAQQKCLTGNANAASRSEARQQRLVELNDRAVLCEEGETVAWILEAGGAVTRAEQEGHGQPNENAVREGKPISRARAASARLVRLTRCDARADLGVHHDFRCALVCADCNAPILRRRSPEVKGVPRWAGDGSGAQGWEGSKLRRSCGEAIDPKRAGHRAAGSPWGVASARSGATSGRAEDGRVARRGMQSQRPRPRGTGGGCALRSTRQGGLLYAMARGPTASRPARSRAEQSRSGLAGARPDRGGRAPQGHDQGTDLGP